MRVTCIVLCVLALAVPAGAQTGWTSYLQGDTRDRAAEATNTLEAAWARETVAYRTLYAAIEDLYVARRAGDLDREAYVSELAGLGLPTRQELAGANDPAEPATDGDTPPGGALGARSEPLQRGMSNAVRSSDMIAARATIAATLGEQLPPPGSRSYAAAERWFTRLARREGFPVERFLAAVRATDAVIDGLDAREVRTLTDALPVSSDASELSAEDLAAQLLRMWSVRVLGAEDPDRVALLSDLAAFLRDTASDTAAELATTFSQIAADRRASIRLERELSLAAESYAALGASHFSDPGRGAGMATGLQDLARVLLLLVETDADLVATLQVREPFVGFFIDTADALLAALSPLQRYRLAAAMGLPPATIEAARIALYRSRAAAAERVLADLVTTPERSPDEVFSRFRSEGSDHVSSAQPWADGERSRSGDSFRWAMLSIVSHPYAQFMLGTLPELSETREMVDAFLSQTYEEALRRPEMEGATVGAVVIGDALQPFARVYRVPNERTATAFYTAFAAAAQGLSSLPPDFGAPYAGGLTVAGYWSHMHGLHVVVGEAPDIEAAVRARVDAWLSLACAADTVEEDLSLTHRALVSLRRVVTDELEPVRSSSGVASIELYEPRLPIALELLEESAAFTADARETSRRLAELYGTPSGDATTDRIASDLDRLIGRLRDVEIPDRRLIHGRSAAGGASR